ncbi:type II toxin-antitoxin system RelE/ParE family toxin [Candidatus Nomurabacteria bacterium]|nr:type II toxin-antitoxin system RelE/ParE family toxin [Candidatus Kaiserbacteria bacterium]MCB9813854.1 type II toxin-antitoxin system RelE/ParE family toxin [Candidatus Nomurabacteria bacterium]
MEIHWTKPAKHDLEIIHSYIERDNKVAAIKVVTRIYNAIHTQLLNAPLSGRIGPVKNTRELVLSNTPYIIAYKVSEDEIYIIRILHTSLRWPNQM